MPSPAHEGYTEGESMDSEPMRPMDDNRTVLLLACAFPPESLSGAVRAYRFAKYLPNFGYSIEVIAGTCVDSLAGWQNVHRVPRSQRLSLRLRLETTLAQMLRRISPYEERLPWIPHVISEAGKILSDRAAVAIVSTSPPVGSHVAALLLKRKYNLKWIADFRDPLLGNPFRNRRIGVHYDKTLERWLFRNADAVIANTDVLADAWLERYPQWESKFKVIWNGYDPEDVIVQARIPSRNFKVLAHIGSIYGGRTPTVLLRSIERLIAHGHLSPRQLRVLFQGPLELSPKIMAHPPYSSLISAGVLECTGKIVPLQQAREIMTKADFLCALDLNDTGVGIQVPAKIFEYIQVGRPILALTSRNSSTQRILAKSGIRHQCIFPDSNELQIDSDLMSFFNLPTEPQPPSEWFWHTFDARNQTGELAALLDYCVGKDSEFRPKSLPVLTTH